MADPIQFSLQVLPAEYAYVIFVAIASIFMNMWLGVCVGKARKLYKIEYPAMYSDKSPIFNCYQRAHQNTLENYPQFLILLFCAGSMYPGYAAIAGIIWIVGRVLYALGYQTGDPKKRMRGAVGYIGLLSLLAMTIMVALRLLRVM